MTTHDLNASSNIIPVLEPDIGELELRKVSDAVSTRWVSSLGEYVKEFETRFAAFCERKYGATTSNGTHALHLALTTLGIGPNDEVLVPNLTFIATANAVLYAKAKPILIDCELDTWNIDPKLIEERLTDKTKAIIVVHLYGHPCDMDPIIDIANKHRLYIIEDAAEAHGSRYRNRMCGSFGDISCFSFYGNKTITTGEGGMCLTNEAELYSRMLLLRDHGMTQTKKYWHEVVGFNYRMTNMQAALGCAQLERIEDFLHLKKRNHDLYREGLAGIPWINFQTEKEYATCNYWLNTILLSNDAPLSRDQLILHLKSKGIDCRNAFYPISDMPPYKNYSMHTNLSYSTDIAYRALSLPSSTKLAPQQIDYICRTIASL